MLTILNQEFVKLVSAIIKNLSKFEKHRIELFEALINDLELWLKVIQLPLDVPDLVTPAHWMHLCVLIDFTD